MLVIYQESLHDARSTKYKISLEFGKYIFKTHFFCNYIFCNHMKLTVNIALASSLRTRCYVVPLMIFT